MDASWTRERRASDARLFQKNEHVNFFYHDARLFLNTHLDIQPWLTSDTFRSITIEIADPKNIPVSVGIFFLC